MMRVETIDSDGKVTAKCTDGFIRSDTALDRIVCPFLLILSRSCLVPVSMNNFMEPSNLIFSVLTS